MISVKEFLGNFYRFFLRTKKFFSLFSLVILSVSSFVIANYAIKINQENRSQAASNCPPDKEVYNIESDFGANGRDGKDDYAPLLLASQCLSNTTSKTLIFPAGTFYIKKYRIVADTSDGRKKNTVRSINYHDSTYLQILGAGSGKTKIDVMGKFALTPDDPFAEGKFLPNARGVEPFELFRCYHCTLSGFELDGNNEETTIDPTIYQPGPSGGIRTTGSSDYTISDINSHHFISDGIYIGAGANEIADEGATIINSSFGGNGRIGGVVIQARKVTFVNTYFGNGVYFKPGSAAHIEPNRNTLSRINKLTGNILYYNSKGSLLESGQTNASGNPYRTIFSIPLKVPAGFKNKVALNDKVKYGNCQPAASYFTADFISGSLFLSSDKFDIDDDGMVDTKPCHPANFQLLRGQVEFELPAGSNAPHEARIKLNGVTYAPTVTVSGNKLIVDTATLPNGHWKMDFSVKDASGEVVPTALVPVIIANARPKFTLGFAPSLTPSPSPSPSPTATPSPTVTPTQTPIPTATASPSPTSTPSLVPSVSPTAAPTTDPSVSPTSSPSTKAGDINGDGNVNVLDYTLLFENFGKSPIPDERADINGDDKVDILDYTILFENFGE